MIDPKLKKQFIKDTEPKQISAKEILRELRKKKSTIKENESVSSKNSFNPTIPRDKSKKKNFNSLLSPFLGRNVRYLMVVLALFVVSIVSFTFTLVDTTSFDNRNLAESINPPSISFESHSTVNVWQTICYLNDSSKCNLNFKTQNVLSIDSLNVPNYLKVSFDYSTQTGKFEILYENVDQKFIDSPVNITIILNSSSSDLNKVYDHQFIFTNGNYKDSAQLKDYTINYFNGECTRFISNSSLITRTFQNYEECVKYTKSIGDYVKLKNGLTYDINVVQNCISNDNTYTASLDFEWEDSKDELSYIKIGDSPYQTFISPSFAEYQKLRAKNLYVENITKDNISNKAKITFKFSPDQIKKGYATIPITVYYPTNVITSKNYNIFLNFVLSSDSNYNYNVDYKVENFNDNLKISANLSSVCRFNLAKIELWDQYCSKYVDTILSESIIYSVIDSEFQTKKLQKGTYCARIFVRNSSSSRWETFDIKDLSLNLTKNSAPIILSKPKMTDIMGNQQFNYSISYSDLENDSVLLQVLQKPSWVVQNGLTLSGIPSEQGSNLVALRVQDISGNYSDTQQFYINSINKPVNMTFDESNLVAQATEIKVSGNVKVKWSLSTYTAIVKQEVYIAKQGSGYSLIATYNEGLTSSITVNTKDYSDGKYTFKIKAYLDDGETVEQISSTYVFYNPVVVSTSSSSSETTSTQSQTTSSKTSTAQTSVSTSKTTQSAQTSSTSSVTSGTSSSSPEIVTATIKDQSPLSNSKVDRSTLKISGKIIFPEGKSYLENSLKIFLDGKDISDKCTIVNGEYSCNDSEVRKVLENRAGNVELEIAYSDNSQVIYSQKIPFELIQNTTDSSTSKVSSVDEEKVVVLFGRKVPNFVLYGFFAVIAILLLVFAIPWLLFFISERRMNNKVKKLASI